MRRQLIAAIGMMITVTVLAAPCPAQVEVTVEELDVAGNPPGLEGMPGMFLTNQDSGTEHLVVFGGCTDDSMWDQALVLSDLSSGFDDLTWTTVPVPGMGAACEHIVVGDGDVGYLIGGFQHDFDTRRPMSSILELRLTGSESNPVIETSELTADCTECPETRIGHAAVWLDEVEACESPAVLMTGGIGDDWFVRDDTWLLCLIHQPKRAQWIWIEDHPLRFPTSDHAMGVMEWGKSPVAVIYDPLIGQPTLETVLFDRVRQGWVVLDTIGEAPPARYGAGSYIVKGNKMVVFGGVDPNTGVVLRDVWELRLESEWGDAPKAKWTRLPNDLDEATANQIVELSGPPPRTKISGDTTALMFGGVIDYASRTLSSSTYLFTTTDHGPPSHFAVPAVARVQGAGAFFTSVMHLFAAGASDLELEMTFTPRQGSGGAVKTVTHTVPAGVMQTIDDPIETLFGHTGSAGRVGSVLVTVTSGNPADLMLQTVVFAELDTGEEYGQFFPAMAVSGAIGAGQLVYLNTTEDPSHNRVNVGLMAVADGTRFNVRPVDPIGTGLAPARTFDLDAGGNTQINNLHSTFGLGPMPDVVVEVKVVSGSGLAYSSVLDGSGAYTGTSDPTTILPAFGGSSTVTLLEIGSIQGLNEFSGSACITNYSNRTSEVRADFYQRGMSGVTATENLTLAAGETIGYTDLGADLFGVSGDVGTVVLTATNGTEIGATGREFAIFRDGGEIVGTAGQLIAGQTNGDRVQPGQEAHFIGLRQTRSGGAAERSHLAIFNPAPAEAEVTVRLFDGATGAAEGMRTWIVDAQTLIQINNIIKAVDPSSDAEEKRIVVEADRWVFMNAFRVNPWGDPVTLSPLTQ